MPRIDIQKRYLGDASEYLYVANGFEQRKGRPAMAGHVGKYQKPERVFRAHPPKASQAVQLPVGRVKTKNRFLISGVL